MSITNVIDILLQFNIVLCSVLSSFKFIIDMYAPSPEALRCPAGIGEAALGSSPCQLSAPTPPPCETPPSAPSDAMHSGLSVHSGRQPATKSKRKTKDTLTHQCKSVCSFLSHTAMTTLLHFTI